MSFLSRILDWFSSSGKEIKEEVIVPNDELNFICEENRRNAFEDHLYDLREKGLTQFKGLQKISDLREEWNFPSEDTCFLAIIKFYGYYPREDFGWELSKESAPKLETQPLEMEKDVVVIEEEDRGEFPPHKCTRCSTVITTKYSLCTVHRKYFAAIQKKKREQRAGV